MNGLLGSAHLPLPQDVIALQPGRVNRQDLQLKSLRYFVALGDKTQPLHPGLQQFSYGAVVVAGGLTRGDENGRHSVSR